jgi:hypothetical protein
MVPLNWGARTLGPTLELHGLRRLQDHPTVKPVAMLEDEDALLDMTNRDDIVLDPLLC